MIVCDDRSALRIPFSPALSLPLKLYLFVALTLFILSIAAPCDYGAATNHPNDYLFKLAAVLCYLPVNPRNEKGSLKVSEAEIGK